jgi:hypothetical protein
MVFLKQGFDAERAENAEIAEQVFERPSREARSIEYPLGALRFRRTLRQSLAYK